MMTGSFDGRPALGGADLAAAGLGAADPADAGLGDADPGDADPGDADPADADPAAREQALQKALNLSYAFINRRERTVAEVRSQLERKGVSEADADATVETLIEQHLVDDERFAQLFVSDKRELERWGVERIRRGLSARGIDRALAERTLAAAPDAVDHANLDPPRAEHCEANLDPPRAEHYDGRGGELSRALELLRRRFPNPPRERRDRDRALGMLLRKGYEHELALDALSAHAHGD
jgi:regulatory protein